MTDKKTETETPEVKAETVEENLENQVEGEVESPETAEAGSDQPSYEDLVKLLAELQSKSDESNERALRAQAELENVRRRAQRDVESAHKFALEKFVNALLPVKDSLDMGEAAAKAEGADIEKVREGLELTTKMMSDVMGKFNVEEVNPVGEKFNPDHHQAMSMQDLPDAPPNTVVNVFQKGYLLNGRLVRPAMVVVSSANSGSNLDGNEPPAGAKIDELA